NAYRNRTLPRGIASTRSLVAASVRPSAPRLRTVICRHPGVRFPPVHVWRPAWTRAPRAPTVTRVDTDPDSGRVHETTNRVVARTSVEMGATIVSGPAWCCGDAFTGAIGLAMPVECSIRFPTSRRSLDDVRGRVG